MNLVFIDFETTGLYFEKGERIIEIGAVKVDSQGNYFYFQKLVNPQRQIPLAVQKIHNITDDMVNKLPPIEKIIEDFRKFIDERCILGYNLDFDLSFLVPYLGFSFLKDKLLIDVLKMAKFCFKNLKSYSLENVCKYLNIETSKFHRALDDALNTSKVFFICKEIIDKNNKLSLEEISERFGSNFIRK